MKTRFFSIAAQAAVLVLGVVSFCHAQGLIVEPADIIVVHGRVYTENPKQPWAQAVAADGTFKPRAELEQLYKQTGVLGKKEVIAYCRIGERSSHTWFALKYLLGHKKVRNYDGSWTEWGNLVGAPITKGATP